MLAVPEPLVSHHEVAGFDSGAPSLDDWLKRRTESPLDPLTLMSTINDLRASLGD
ncbi:MAG TPA: hypothetical protein VLA16_12250 [Ideonella sp.]|nr:hypothetical protein [Ideonella sp.]